MGFLTSLIEETQRKVLDEKFGNIQNTINNNNKTTPPPPVEVQCKCTCSDKVSTNNNNNNEKLIQYYNKYEEAKLVAEAREQFGWSALAFASTTAVITTFSIRLYFPAIALLPLSIMGTFS